MALVNNPIDIIVDKDISINSETKKLVDLTYYAQKNIPDYMDITEIPQEHIDYINTVCASSCRAMFWDCGKITTVDLSNFDTSNVTDTYEMFFFCELLKSLDVSNWDTSKIIIADGMFNHCRSLKSLDVSNWDTGNITDMEHLFDTCYGLTSLDISNWNTSKVTDMRNMFHSCTSLTTLDMSKWNTSKVTGMYCMFHDCRKLTALNLSSFNTSKVTDMHHMFCACSSLTSLDLSNFDTSNVIIMRSMFSGCSALETIKGTLDLSSCANCINMFSGLTNLNEAIHLKNVPDVLLDTDGSLKNSGGTLNKTYIIDNVLTNFDKFTIENIKYDDRFNLDEVKYFLYEKEMTWGEWVNSKCNSEGFIIINDTIGLPNREGSVCEKSLFSKKVKSTDKIIKHTDGLTRYIFE